MYFYTTIITSLFFTVKFLIKERGKLTLSLQTDVCPLGFS